MHQSLAALDDRLHTVGSRLVIRRGPTLDTLRALLIETGADAVFCPAEDGGYMLVGMSQAMPALFEAMSWGTDTVMEETRQRLRSAGWRWHELPPHWDVDRPEDYQRLLREGWLSAQTSCTASDEPRPWPESADSRQVRRPTP